MDKTWEQSLQFGNRRIVCSNGTSKVAVKYAAASQSYGDNGHRISSLCRRQWAYIISSLAADCSKGLKLDASASPSYNLLIKIKKHGAQSSSSIDGLIPIDHMHIYAICIKHHPTVTTLFRPQKKCYTYFHIASSISNHHFPSQKNITHTFTDVNNQKDTWPREDMYHGPEQVR